MTHTDLYQIASLDSQGIPPYFKFRHIFCFICSKSIIEIDKRDLSDDE
ncbi:MAG: hypothetical protein BWX99_00701 [Deltaproteobacteria bacterium ADurb.Bin151]|jgi:hypothetical protein|nr:MAG: hypothetical protein BWX99_00701 [Deltaproteobacteria bacterium ADurb.Bin151]